MSGEHVEVRSRRRRVLAVVVGGSCFVILACALYAASGFGTLLVFSWFYEGRGHPPLPGAPNWLYIAAYFVVLPILCLGAAGRVGWVLARTVWKRR